MGGLRPDLTVGHGLKHDRTQARNAIGDIQHRDDGCRDDDGGFDFLQHDDCSRKNGSCRDDWEMHHVQ